MEAYSATMQHVWQSIMAHDGSRHDVLLMFVLVVVS
jgi:hypothetical protein